MATEVRQAAKLSGDRPRRLFRAAGSENKDYRLSAAAIARTRSAFVARIERSEIRDLHCRQVSPDFAFAQSGLRITRATPAANRPHRAAAPKVRSAPGAP